MIQEKQITKVTYFFSNNGLYNVFRLIIPLALYFTICFILCFNHVLHAHVLYHKGLRRRVSFNSCIVIFYSKTSLRAQTKKTHKSSFNQGVPYCTCTFHNICSHLVILFCMGWTRGQIFTGSHFLF